MLKTKQLIDKYYAFLEQALYENTYNFQTLPFSEEIAFIGPNERFVGKEAVQTMLPFFVKLIKKYTFQEQFFSEKSAVIIIEYTPLNGESPILAVEWFIIKNEKIDKVNLIYDTESWKKILDKNSS